MDTNQTPIKDTIMKEQRERERELVISIQWPVCKVHLLECPLGLYMLNRESVCVQFSGHCGSEIADNYSTLSVFRTNAVR